MGPRLDSLDSARIGSSRAITQLILNLVDGTPIQLVDGGAQKRCFTDIEDGIEALFRIIENKENRCDGQIINIGNPDNEASIQQMAEILLAKFEAHPLRDQFPPFAGFKLVESKSFYGDGYQDVSHRLEHRQCPSPAGLGADHRDGRDHWQHPRLLPARGGHDGSRA